VTDEEAVGRIKAEIWASEVRVVGLFIWALHPNHWWAGFGLFLVGCFLSDSARRAKEKKERV
jgi:hypothetical protein